MELRGVIHACILPQMACQRKQVISVLAVFWKYFASFF
tara:strand:- start:1391 stop:1504 length:114 start_codon:yes stop_codon:yes gene_type:complete